MQALDDDLLADERLTLGGLLYEVMSGFDARLFQQFAEHGLTNVEFGVLIRLARSPNSRLRMSDLTTQMALTNSGITRVIDRLSRDGLVAREASPTDRRSIYAVITGAGMQRLAAILPGHLDIVQQSFVDPLREDEFAALCSILRVLRDRLRPDATAGADGGADDLPGSGAPGTAPGGSPDASRSSGVTI